MSYDNVVTVNRLYEASKNRDFLTFFSLISPELHVTRCPQVPWGGVFQGLEEAKVFLGKLYTYIDYVAIEHIIDDGDRIAVIGRGKGRIRGTRGPFDVPIMHLWAFEDGLAVRLEIVLDVSKMQAALEAHVQAGGGTSDLTNEQIFFANGLSTRAFALKERH